MDLYTKVEETLNKLNIPFEIVEHEPALTTEQADCFIEGIEGVRTKTMFLTNKKKTAYYLLIMDDKKRLDMDLFKELLNNADKDIQVYFDKEIMLEKRMSFHPNTNEKTLFLNTTDLLKFLEAIGYEAHIVEL